MRTREAATESTGTFCLRGSSEAAAATCQITTTPTTTEAECSRSAGAAQRLLSMPGRGVGIWDALAAEGVKPAATLLQARRNRRRAAPWRKEAPASA